MRGRAGKIGPVAAGAIVAGNIRHYLATGDLPETVDMKKGY